MGVWFNYLNLKKKIEHLFYTIIFNVLVAFPNYQLVKKNVYYILPNLFNLKKSKAEGSQSNKL